MVKKCMLFFCMGMIVMPFAVRSQTFAKRSDMNTTSSETWEPVNATSSGSNTVNNVSFYGKKSTCGTEEVLLLRIVNGNKFPVKVQWQAAPAKSVVTINVTPASEIEGSCLTAGAKGQQDLTIAVPKDAKERLRNKEFFANHVTVTEEK